MRVRDAPMARLYGGRNRHREKRRGRWAAIKLPQNKNEKGAEGTNGENGEERASIRFPQQPPSIPPQGEGAMRVVVCGGGWCMRLYGELTAVRKSCFEAFGVIFFQNVVHFKLKQYFCQCLSIL